MRIIKFIKSIRLINFQSHIDSTIEFEKGLNVIVGPSDSGKTAIIRAIIWVLFDEPLGDSIIRIGTKEATVIITMYDGSYVKKTRTNRAIYEIYDSLKGEKEEYQGSRGDVKKRVSDILGIRFSSNNEKESYNIHNQLSSPFLIADGPTAKAQAIGKLVGIDVLDEAVGDTRKDIVQKKQSINATLNQKDDLEELLLKFNDLEDEKISLFKANENLNLAKSLNEKLSKLKNIQKTLFTVDENINNNKKRIEELDKLLESEDLINELDSLVLKISLFSNYIKKTKDISLNITKNRELVKQTALIIKNEKIIDLISEKNLLFSKLTRLNNSYEETLNRKNLQNKIINNLSFIDDIDIGKMEVNYDRYEKLLNLEKNIKINKDKIESKKSIIDKYKKIGQIDKIIIDTNSLIDKFRDLKKISTEKETNDNRIKKGKIYIASINKEIEEIAELYGQELKVNGRCPTCLSEIDDNRLEIIVMELEV